MLFIPFPLDDRAECVSAIMTDGYCYTKKILDREEEKWRHVLSPLFLRHIREYQKNAVGRQYFLLSPESQLFSG